ncbi:hypothetical protein K7432_010147 [Basidiobolus ranarum]|uniref:glucan endo-1,3-beta-D-glucosidase n=1 Tax=Basidiobolus ranarum TaxID=34480 RepID=A0ABR2VWR1_9FUNG
MDNSEIVTIPPINSSVEKREQPNTSEFIKFSHITSKQSLKTRKWFLSCLFLFILILSLTGFLCFYIFKRFFTVTSSTIINYDSNLRHAFWGLCYTPQSSQFPRCGVTGDDVLNEIKILSQLTKRVRLYGMDCNQGEFVLEAIHRLKIDMKVVLTVWIDSNSVTYERQSKELIRVLSKYGTANIYGISLGNEVLFRKEMDDTALFGRLKQLRDTLRAQNWDIPVFTSEIGSLIDTELVSEVDLVMANIHPYFAGTIVSDASNWTLSYFKQSIQALIPPSKAGIISEVGWPTRGDRNQGSIPNVNNQQLFLNDFLCKANRLQIPYFYFEVFDSPWKIQFNQLETSWGIFDAKKNLKVDIPNCLVID